MLLSLGVFSFATLAARSLRAAAPPAITPAPPGELRTALVWAVAAAVVALVALAALQLSHLAALARARAAFIAGISHELRTPLAQVLLFAELLQDERQHSRAEQRGRWAAGIEREARRLGLLVENVILFARVEQGTYLPAREPVDLRAELEAVACLLRPQALARRAQLVVAAPEGILVEADPVALGAMVQNLVDNALKFGPPGQTVEIGAMAEAGGTVLWVDDAGPGVPERARESVWRPFRRLAREVERASGGGGIGLALVRRLAELHDAEVWIERSPAGGARVGIRFPPAGRAPGRRVAGPGWRHFTTRR